MFDSAWFMLSVACFATTLGLAFLALAMDVHWEQVRRNAQTHSVQRLLHGIGAVALLVSLSLCVAVDHATMAVLVWIMLLAPAAALVAALLAWRPHWLAILVAWVPQPDARHTAQ